MTISTPKTPHETSLHHKALKAAIFGLQSAYLDKTHMELHQSKGVS